MGILGYTHERLVFGRRVRALAEELAVAIPQTSRSILDVGCGDGTIDTLLSCQRPELSIFGVDVLVRPNAQIRVSKFDGTHLPFEDKSFDVVMFVDVLHHTEDPNVLLREAQRVATKTSAPRDFAI